MTQSMTGYSRAESQGPWGRLSWEIRSVNHRYLDLGLRIPDELRALEPALRQQLGSRVQRGKVEVTLRFSREGAAPQIDVDLTRVQVLRDAAQTAVQAWGDTSAPDPVRLLSMPGVLIERAPDFESVGAAATELFTQALDAFVAARSSEGARLEAFLLDRCDRINGMVDEVRARYSQVSTNSIERLRARAAELQVELDQGRLEQEMVIALQKLDVEEEMSRLHSHVEEVRKALSRSESIGRRLDFLMQELNREANTLSSKSQDAELSRLAVDLKVCIEQCREQVQNIE